MMRRPAIIAAALATLCGVAYAETLLTAPAPDMSGYALQSQLPQPATSVPPMESPGGAAGTAGTYRRGDAVQPRITRSKTIVLASDGTGTFDWGALGQAALATPVQVSFGPVYSGSGIPKCWATATSATAVSVKCVIENSASITLAIVTSGLVLNNAANGMSVGLIVLPPS